MNYCPNCGTKIIPNAKFCIECGYNLNVIDNEIKEENKFKDESYITNGNISSKVEKVSSAKKIRKNFDILNKKDKSSNNNFDLIRPNTSKQDIKKNYPSDFKNKKL